MIKNHKINEYLFESILLIITVFLDSTFGKMKPDNKLITINDKLIPFQILLSVKNPNVIK